MANYVKFMRGTTAAYNKLTDTEKDKDTLYFLSDSDDQEGSLYLGTKLIAGPDSISEATSLGALLDVALTPGLDYDAILMYDNVEMKWRDYSFDALTFRAANETFEGASGFVPAPQINDINKFLRGDGTWATVGSECQIFDSIKTSVNQSHASALEQHTSGFILNKGDIAIIQDFIIDGKYQYTSYIYNGEKWCALDKEYNAENVYLKSDFTLNDNENTTIPSAGKNIAEAFQLILSHIETAVLADLKTVTFDGRTLGLKDFGKYYYKYIPESGSKDEGNYIAARYEKQAVDADNPWRAGLEPKVVNENGVLVLGWYEPNPTTIEGINSQIAGLQSSIDVLTTSTTNLTTRVNNTYTKLETDEKIAAAPHLKRKKVDSKEEIDLTAADADQYIYMIPTGFEDEDNKYDEYIIVETKVVDDENIETIIKSIERVGSWEVNLDEYAKKVDVDSAHTAIQNSINDLRQEIEDVDAKAETNLINSVSESFEVDENTNRQLKLVSIPTDINLASNTSLLNLFVQKEINKSLVENSEIVKLSTVESGAEKNVIHSIDTEEFSITADIERKLSIKQIDGAKIINLNNNTQFSTMQNNISDIQQQMNDINSSIVNIQTNFVRKTTYENDMSDIWERLTWHDL